MRKCEPVSQIHRFAAGVLRGRRLAGLTIAVLLWISVSGARTQQGQDVEVDLGSDLSVPGGDSFLPLTLAGKGAQKVVSEISFPRDILAYVEAKRGEAGEQVDAEIKTEVKPSGGNGRAAILQVTISGAKELPEGVLVTLKFAVSKSAPETDVKLANAVKVVSVSGQEIKQAKGNEAILTISPAKLPEVGCFFFTH